MPRRSRIPKPRFYLEDKSARKPTGITMIYSYGGDYPLKYATGEEVEPKYWKQKEQSLVLKTAHEEELEKYLQKLSTTAVSIFKEFDMGDISPPKFRLEMDYRMGFRKRVERKKVQLFDFIEKYISDREELIGSVRGTNKVLRTWQRIMLDFSKYEKMPFEYEDLDSNWWDRFKKHCFEEKEHSINYVHKGLTVIRQFMQAARRKEYHSNVRYLDFKASKLKTNKVVLYSDELEKIAALELPEHLRVTRAMLFLGCYTGLRNSDWGKVTKERLKDRAGEKFFEIVTEKTKARVNIPLSPILESVMDEYDWKIPIKKQQHFNREVKEVVKLAIPNVKYEWVSSNKGEVKTEIVPKWSKVASHVCRRSFATNLYLKGFDPSLLRQITGQTESMFMQYVNTSGREISKVLSKI